MMKAADMLEGLQPPPRQRHRRPRTGRHVLGGDQRQPNRDVPLGDPAMGGHASFAMGLALAQPDEKIVLFDSDGDIQMSLGILCHDRRAAAENFYHFMLDNECYATTGGQPVPNAKNVATTCSRKAPAIRARLRSPSWMNSRKPCPRSSNSPDRCSPP